MIVNNIPKALAIFIDTSPVEGSHNLIDSNGVYVAINSSKTSLENQINSKANTNHQHAASDINNGTFNVEQIPALSTAKITSGIFDVARIPADSVPTKGSNKMITSNAVFNAIDKLVESLMAGEVNAELLSNAGERLLTTSGDVLLGTRRIDVN